MAEYNPSLLSNIPLNNLMKHITARNGIIIRYEYETIEDNNSIFDFDESLYISALEEENKTKNRYANVLPIENTRVKLKKIDSDQNSDYINANYISINDEEKVYIASQGCLPTTQDDFWRMIWEEDADTIVMVTKLIENNREKCSKYWPDEVNETKKYSKISVTYLNIETIEPNLLLRKFEVKHDKYNETRIIKQIQYCEWPDHGLPSSSNIFRLLLNKVDEIHVKKTPIIVHCRFILLLFIFIFGRRIFDIFIVFF
eukprot:TRINITY_DN613_c0_g1_i3.p1 TRINITY_DN613_c0_g1~~TRINITY_DN613_c0_g1_i3.p1  ORF type:complete len:257 (+),score=63.88 TRINITY_DN613_c0_g1_i3:44-814(+)